MHRDDISEILIGVMLSAVLLGIQLLNPELISLVEVLGFITGAACVWLCVRDSVWNWPVGIANSIFFLVLFWKAGLYADSALQVVYIVLGVLGWYWWLYGGTSHSTLQVRSASKLETGAVILCIGLFSIVEYKYLVSINDSAPFLDALTTAISLGAQWLLSRKMIQNWYFWITADIIYIGLYWDRGLYLASILYFIFLCMCIKGIIDWRKIWTKKNSALA